MGDDRPKKSWRDVDAKRDGRRGTSGADGGAKRQEKIEQSSAYRAYKQQLDGLFKPGGTALPPALREKLGPTTDEQRDQQALLQALTADPKRETLAPVLEAGLALPRDARVLIRLLEISEPALVIPVLDLLIEIVESGQRPSRMLLIQRVDALRHRTDDSAVLERAGTLRSALD